MATYNGIMLTFTSILCLTGTVITQDQVEMTTVLGSSATFTCTVDVTAQASWRDVANNNLIIYSMDLQRQPVKSYEARADNKYLYYTAALVDSTQFNLQIASVNITDVGVIECTEFPSTSLLMEYTITVQAKVEPLTIDCISPCDNFFDGSIEVLEATTCQCICSGNGGYPNSLLLQWNKGSSGSQVTDETSSGPYGTYDFSRSVTFNSERNYSPLICQVEGYTHEGIKNSIDIRSEISFNVLYAPNCTTELKTIEIKDSCNVELTCSCEGNPEISENGYKYFMDSSPIDGSTRTIRVTVPLEPAEEVTFTCSGSNSVGDGDQTAEQRYTCTTLSTPPAITTNSMTGDDRTQRLAPALIVICCIEGVVIITMMFTIGFLFSKNKDWRKEEAQSLEVQPDDTTDKSNPAYMDLQEPDKLTPNFLKVDLPYENFNLREALPGKGPMNYRRAQMVLTSKMEDIVLKTVSDDAPVRLAKLQADEVRMLSKLTPNVNVAQFFGRCNRVPNLLCYEFVNGNKLGHYLRENFQQSKIHQYGNTKRKRYHVAEKGSVENLPRIALQIALGMRYLTAQKFLHPGLRSEKVIMDVSGQCKLYDFLSNENVKETIAILWGESVPYQWMPPEYLFLERLDPCVDVWSFGVLLWEIFSYGALPYEGKGRSDVEKKLREKEYLDIPNNCPGAIWQIALSCWEQSPEKRPSFDHLHLQLSHMCKDNKEYDEIHST